MAAQPCSYVIVTSPSGPGRSGRRSWRLRPGRHRLGTPGTTPRYPAGPPRTRRGRARHRRRMRPGAFAARYASMLVLLGTVAISGWFSFAGATAFAQMVQP